MVHSTKEALVEHGAVPASELIQRGEIVRMKRKDIQDKIREEFPDSDLRLAKYGSAVTLAEVYSALVDHRDDPSKPVVTFEMFEEVQADEECDETIAIAEKMIGIGSELMQEMKGRKFRENPDCALPAVTPLHAGLSHEIIDMVDNIDSSLWSKPGNKEVRCCLSIAFGLCHLPFKPEQIPKGSQELPELQTMIINWVKAVAPHIPFTSFNLFKYTQGHHMKQHADKNMRGFPIQLLTIWGTYKGGRLLVASDEDPSIHLNGTVLLNSVIEHQVTRVTEGQRMSLVTYMKNIEHIPETVIDRLRSEGFQLPTDIAEMSAETSIADDNDSYISGLNESHTPASSSTEGIPLDKRGRPLSGTALSTHLAKRARES